MSSHSWKARKLAALVGAPIVLLSVVACPASVAGAAVPTSLPLISSFTASPNALLNKGGTVALVAVMKFAQTCTLSVSPGVQGLPDKNFPCAASFSKKFSIGKDATDAAVTYTFTLTVANKEGSTTAPQVVVTEGAAPPPISFGVSSKDFGTVGVSIHSTNVEVQVTNNSALPQDLGALTIVGTNASDFTSPSNDCASVALSPRGECSLAIEFIPTSTGKRSATLELDDSSWGPDGGEALLPLSGTGVFSQISISASPTFYSGGDVHFSTQGVGTTTTPLYITVTDASSSVPLYVSAISVSGQNYSDFAVAAGNCVTTEMDPRGQCQFTVSFTPTAAGLRKAQVDVYGNMSGGVWTIPESGSGQYATLTLDSPPGKPITSINFGDTSGAVSTQVTVTNTSSTVFLVFGSASAVSGQNAADFAWSSNSCAYASAELGPGQSCSFAVNFTPQLPNVSYTAIFSLFDNVASASQTLTLSGESKSS